MSTLYRDYRPQNFQEILGQNHIKVTLQNEIKHGRLAQAYLFCGPRAVGKTTMARILAKSINCEDRKDGEYEPCNKCASCTSITSGKNLDIIEIDAASNTGVDNVRENIISFSRLAPGSAKFKVFIIDEVHMLSISAFNALLKIIEEPPAYVVFILCTTEIQKVPSTIISRCERYDFKRISLKEIVEKLAMIANQEKIDVDPAVLESVARRSGGHLRDAESLFGQILSLGDKKITSEQAELVIPRYNSLEAIELISLLSRKDAAKAVALLNQLADSGVSMKIFAVELINLLRQMILNKLNPELADNLGLDLGENLEKNLAQAAENLSWEQLLAFSRRFIEAANDNKSTVVAQLPLELAIVELCFGLGRTTTPADRTSVPPVSPSSPSRTVSRPSIRPAQPGKETVNRTEIEKNREIDHSFSLPAEAVGAKWPEFLMKIKKHNHSLSFVLQNCQPQSIESGQLNLVFKYKFHQDRINDPVIKNILENTIQEIFGVAIAVKATIDENLELRRGGEASLSKEPEAQLPSSTPAAPESQPASGLIADLLKSFGGEIIN